MHLVTCHRPVRRCGAALAALCLAAAAAGQSPLWPPLATGGDNATDLFSTLFPSRVKTMVKSSVDPDDRAAARDQGNDDGFSGLNGCEAYRTVDAGRSMAVLAHVEGRGGVLGLLFRNFWSGSLGAPLYPVVEDNRTRIWLDGALRHDLPLSDYFRTADQAGGQLPPFTGPFTGHRAGGWFTHAQLRWNDSFRIGSWDDGYRNAARFHRVAMTLASPEGELPIADLRAFERVDGARDRWPHATARVPQRQQLRIGARGSKTLRYTGPGTLLELDCQTATPDGMRDLWLRITWDGQPQASVDCPLRLLGAMVEPPYSFPLRGLLSGNDGQRRITCWWPMHFANSAVFELQNRGMQPIDLQLDTCFAAGPHPPPWGYFTASYQHGVTVTGRAFQGPRFPHRRGLLRMLLLEEETDTTGRIPQQLVTHLEGDLCVRTNGTRGDEHTFDASETSIGRWGWYISPSDRPFVSDTSFQSSVLFRQLGGGQFAVDRIMGSVLVFDPIAFVDGIDVVLEHGLQNQSNAEYGLLSFLYLEPDGSRLLLRELDVGNPADEAQAAAQFTEWRHYWQTGACLRDQFYGTPPITDDVRQIRDFYRFRVDRGSTPAQQPIGIGLRLDRLGGASLKYVQADVLVDGQPAGLLHCCTHNPVFPWKEGAEVEVELPRALTDNRAAFTVELRPRPGTDPLQLARIFVYRYTR